MANYSLDFKFPLEFSRGFLRVKHEKQKVNMKTKEITTTDLADFGMRELQELRDILTAWLEHGLPDDFDHDEVRPMMNRNSGNVFLTNSEYQTAMLADGKLESWYYCFNCGHEGFKKDCIINDEGCNICKPMVKNEILANDCNCRS